MACGYKTWRSRSDPELHVLCGEGRDALQTLPTKIRNLGPWAGGREGEINNLRLPYRILLAEQGFVVVHCHVSKTALESQQVRASENRTCPDCEGSVNGHNMVDCGRRNASDAGDENGCRNENLKLTQAR
jgi:hypothetical protein